MAFPLGIAKQKVRVKEVAQWTFYTLQTFFTNVSPFVLCFLCVFNKYKEQFLALLENLSL